MSEHISQMKEARKRMGGSSITRIRRNRKPKISRWETASKRVVGKLGGMEAALALKKTFQELESNNRPEGCCYNNGDELLISLIEQKFSNIELRAWFGIGGYRIGRLTKPKQNKENSALDAHAFSEIDKKNLIRHICSWYARMKDVLFCEAHPKTCFTEAGLTWRSLWREYKSSMEQQQFRIMSYHRFLHYVHQFDPQISLSVPEDNICSDCQTKKLLQDAVPFNDITNL